MIPRSDVSIAQDEVEITRIFFKEYYISGTRIFVGFNYRDPATDLEGKMRLSVYRRLRHRFIEVD